jgi:O-antigen ligase
MKKTLEIVLACIFVGSVLAFGGVQPLTYSLAEVFIFLTVLTFLWNQQWRGQIKLSLPIWPFLFAAWVGLQLLPMPWSVVAAVSPARGLTSKWLATLDAQGGWTTLSIYPHATLLGFLKLLAYLGVFVLAVYLFDSGRRKSLLVLALIWLGCFEAGYGILQHLLNWNKIFTVTNPYDLWVATGTYINRNHFAGLVELTLPFTFASAFYCYQLWSDWRQGLVARNASGNESAAGFQVIFYLFLMLIMVLALIFSWSRGGILAILATLIVLSLLTAFKVRRKAWVLGVVAFAVLAIGFTLWIGLGPVLTRFQQIGQTNYLQTSERGMIWHDTLHLIGKDPILGTGLGTYGEAFRPYQTQLVNLHIDHAHNDYLEFTSETGLLGAGLLFIPIFYLLIRMILAFLNDHRRYRRAIILGCIGATLGLLIHSVTDFNLQVPANAMMFAMILGIGYKAACLEPKIEARKKAAAGVM